MDTLGATTKTLLTNPAESGTEREPEVGDEENAGIPTSDGTDYIDAQTAGEEEITVSERSTTLEAEHNTVEPVAEESKAELKPETGDAEEPESMAVEAAVAVNEQLVRGGETIVGEESATPEPKRKPRKRVSKPAVPKAAAKVSRPAAPKAAELETGGELEVESVAVEATVADLEQAAGEEEAIMTEETTTSTVEGMTEGGIGKAGTTVKDGIVGSLKGLNEIEAEIVTLVRSTVSSTLQVTGSVASEGVNVTRDVLKGALSAAEEVGTGITMSTKSVAKGILMGVSDVGGDLVSVAGTTIRGAVKGASEIGSDVAIVARRTADGILEATKEIGGNLEQVAKEVVSGAVEAAGAIGTTTVSTAKGLLVGVVEGVKEVVSAALPKAGASTREGEEKTP